MDWLAVYNPNRDDGLSWIDGRPARSLLISWKQTLRKLAPILHQAGKFVYANTIVTRIDSCECLDGFYNENGDYPCSLNLCAFLAVHKPAIGWTRDINTLRPDPDALFQRHLHLGVFPTRSHAWSRPYDSGGLLGGRVLPRLWAASQCDPRQAMGSEAARDFGRDQAATQISSRFPVAMRSQSHLRRTSMRSL